MKSVRERIKALQRLRYNDRPKGVALVFLSGNGWEAKYMGKTVLYTTEKSAIKHIRLETTAPIIIIDL